MKLADLTVTGFADIVASDAPAPGGGSCAALYGSIGAALIARSPPNSQSTLPKLRKRATSSSAACSM